MQGYQSYTQAVGVLEVNDARDAFLSSLCSFALSSKMAEDADVDLPTSPASVTSTSGLCLCVYLCVYVSLCVFLCLCMCACLSACPCVTRTGDLAAVMLLYLTVVSHCRAMLLASVTSTSHESPD